MTAVDSQAAQPLTDDEVRQMTAYWYAEIYLSVGQISLYDNPLLREPLKAEHVKPRLLGHWGTTPGLNFIYVHLNRVIKAQDLNVIYIAGPGHGGPGLVANTYLEGTYSEFYPNISQDAEGLKRLFTQFSFPGGIPSHVAPETPGSIHEGGELGYALSHAYGFKERPKWPMVVLRWPKGWTGPKEVDGKKTEDSWRSHQVPMSDMAHPGHVQILERWMKSYKPEELFDPTGRLIPELAELA